MGAVANYVDSDGPLPQPLADAFRIEQYGPPFAGGWMEWPLKWLHPVETAHNVYRVLSEYTDAMNRYEDDALQDWRKRNARLEKAALAIIRMRDELEGDDGDGGDQL